MWQIDNGRRSSEHLKMGWNNNAQTDYEENLKEYRQSEFANIKENEEVLILLHFLFLWRQILVNSF